jgi:predicted lipid-binding transport protein (Tim44 family)
MQQLAAVPRRELRKQRPDGQAQSAPGEVARAHEPQYNQVPKKERRASRIFRGGVMIILGLVLLVLGLFLGIQLLYILGAILLVVGVVLLILGATGRTIGGRRHYF